MFRQIIAILLLTAFIAQTFTGSLIRLDYYINTNAYAKNCINKARPKMNCNGNCQVMKKMREEERKEQQDMERKFDRKVNVLSSKSFYTADIVNFSTFVSIDHYLPKEQKEIKMPRSFFHPPDNNI